MKKNQKYKNRNSNQSKNGNRGNNHQITTKNLGTEEATRTLRKLGHLSRRNSMDALDRLLSKRSEWKRASLVSEVWRKWKMGYVSQYRYSPR